MTLMLIKNESPLGHDLDQRLAPYGINVVHYRHPLKALDNLVEVHPKILLYDLQDYPRHWKIIIKYLRDEYQKDEVVFLLFSEAKPTLEEANKALYLGVNGILQYDGNGENLAKSIREIFLRYGALGNPDGKNYRQSDDAKRLGFMFRHPRRKHLVTGMLVRLEETWATFKPDFGHEISDLEPGDELHSCSLRIDDALLTLDAVVEKNTGQLHLEIKPLKPEDGKTLRSKLTQFAS